MDDIFEDAVEKLLLAPPAVPDPTDPSTHLSKEDLLQFLSLDCIPGAMLRVCETKGLSLSTHNYFACNLRTRP